MRTRTAFAVASLLTGTLATWVPVWAQEATAAIVAPDPVARDPLRLLALGDSYTIGEGVDPLGRWPVQLVRQLNETGIRTAMPTVVARTGWTTGDLLDAVATRNRPTALEAQRLRGPYDLVMVSIGVNNQFQRRPEDEYARELDLVLAQALALAGDRRDRVVVVSFPDWAVSRYGVSEGVPAARLAREVDSFNATARAATEREHLAWVDITPLSRRVAAEPGMFAPDGLHPSAAQYALWVAEILPAVERALAPAPPETP